MSAADLARLYEELPPGVSLKIPDSSARTHSNADLWGWDSLPGRLTEISAQRHSAQLTVASELIVWAQLENELCAWVTLGDQIFYPPDFEYNGVDLDSLVVVRSPSLLQQIRAVDHLARSGSFGLVIVDLTQDPDIPTSALTRLSGLAAHHAMAIVFLTRKPSSAPSLGSLISLRFETVCVKTPKNPNGGDPIGRCVWEVLKDKRRGPGRRREVEIDGPPGMR